MKHWSIGSLLLFLFAAVSVPAQNIEVSPTGPIKTLMGARDKARTERGAGRNGPITITVHEGVYYLPNTLVLGPEDSDTVWEAPHGEHPVISGGRKIPGWTKTSGSIWTASAPADHSGRAFHQLFIDGRRATRARTPNNGFYRIEGESSLPGPPAVVHYRGDSIKKEWADRGDVEVIELLHWSDLRMPIVSVDESAHTATLAGSAHPSNREADARYYIENAPDALDDAGEWYLDRGKGIVSYIPASGEDMNRATVVAPSLVKLVSLEGDAKSGKLVRNITFRGLTFVHADWDMGARGYADMQAASPAPAAIEVTGAEHFTLEHCTIAHSGGYAVYLGRGSKHNRIAAAEIYDMGAGGVKIGEDKPAADDTDQNYDNAIVDNQIHDLGLVYAPAVGVWVRQSSNNQILHNHIHDLYYTAISVGWTWGYKENQSKGNIIAYNHLHDIGKEMLSDMGGIYTLGVQPGTIIRNNLIHDISSFKYGGWGIYPDEGSSNILIENNIVYNCKSAGFHQHYGQDNIVRNNIFAFNRDFQLMRTRAENHNSFTMEGNIVYMDRGGLLGSNWDEKQGQFTMRKNVYYDTRGREINFAKRTFAEWQAAGLDQNSVIADPLFANAANYDFRLRPESPALKMGFQQIDVSMVGPRERAGADAW